MLDAAQRKAIEPSCQCVTRRVLLRDPENDDSMTFVEHNPRLKSAGNPRRLTVNISAKPSRKLAAAEGWSFSKACASFSKRASPSEAGNRQAAFMTCRICPC